MVRFTSAKFDYFFHFQPVVTPMSCLGLFLLSPLHSEVPCSRQVHPSHFPSALIATVIPLQLLGLYYPPLPGLRPCLILPQRTLKDWLPKNFWFPPSISRWNPLTAAPAQVQIWMTPQVSFARVFVILSHHHHLYTWVPTLKVVLPISN